MILGPALSILGMTDESPNYLDYCELANEPVRSRLQTGFKTYQIGLEVEHFGDF